MTANLERVFTDVSQIPPPTRWAYYGPFRFFTGGKTVEGLGPSYVRLHDGAVEARLELRRQALDQSVPHDGDLEIKTDAGTAVATHARAYPRCFSSNIGYTVHFHDLTLGDLSQKAELTRETVLGVTLGPPDTVAASFTSLVFGRQAFITGCRARGKKKIDSLQVIYEGAPLALDSDERPTLHDLMRFLGGRRGGSWFVETFDARGTRLSFYFQYHGRIARFNSFLQPIELRYRSPDVAALATALPHMLEKLHEFRRARPAKVAAMIHHFNDAAAQNYPTSRLRDLSVALESLVGAVRGSQPKGVPWLQTGFDELIKPVLEAFDASFASVPDPPRAILRKKIVDVNNASPREDLFRFLDGYGAKPWPVEQEIILRYRNGILHTGHKGDESDPDTLSRNQEAADALANVFNRGLLKILGYGGNYYDSREWKSVPPDAEPKYPLLEEMLAKSSPQPAAPTG